MIILHFFYAEKNPVIQYLFLNFQRIYGRKDNNSFMDNRKVNEYAANSCTAYGRVYSRNGYQEAIVLDMKTPVTQKFHKTLYNCYF